ncbi:MAG: PilZ domain-containing protein [Desulfobacterales bacterium]|jgi:hypothetical protein
MSRIEYRAAERFNFEAPVVIENCQTGDRYDGSVYNYSRGGLYMELDHSLEPGSEVRILIENPQNATGFEICQAKTVWCKEIPGAVVLYDYGIGVRYDMDVNCSSYLKKFHIINGGMSDLK